MSPELMHEPIESLEQEAEMGMMRGGAQPGMQGGMPRIEPEGVIVSGAKQGAISGAYIAGMFVLIAVILLIFTQL